MEHCKTLIRIATLALLCAPPLAAAAGDDPLAACYASSKTNLDVAPCLQQTLDTAEQQLAAAERKRAALVAGMPDDASAATRRQTEAGVRPAFERYRDALCRARGALLLPGSGAGAAELACRIEITRLQAGLIAEF